ncbi:helix-turn-helix domain-containing protein [Dactylosporangium sp. NPDC050588]|uniref:helix-turn-helix domain-containing protein n=1 Tax=Dactylosporangium sp. NPDC050588 TaxID=3157211 RepID=UPI0033EA75FC
MQRGLDREGGDAGSRCAPRTARGLLDLLSGRGGDHRLHAADVRRDPLEVRPDEGRRPVRGADQSGAGDRRRPTTGATVTAIAARWGFASHSRFTASYRVTYGEPPSTTLRDR